jgi:hypothetical protein
MANNISFEEKKYSATVTEYSCIVLNSINNLIYSAVIIFIIGTSLAIYTEIYGGYAYQIIVIIVTAIYCLLFFRCTIVEESITIIKQFGIQHRIKYLSGSQRVNFIECTRIEGVFMHEFILGSRVNYCLSFLLKEGSMALVYRHIYPGIDSLRCVYWTCKKNL